MNEFNESVGMVVVNGVRYRPEDAPEVEVHPVVEVEAVEAEPAKDGEPDSDIVEGKDGVPVITPKGAVAPANKSRTPRDK